MKTSPKTIGRGNTAERIESLNDERDRQALSEALDESPLNGRERAMNMELVSLRRQLDVERARNAVLVMGGKGSTPIGDTAERLTAIEDRLLEAAKMRDEDAAAAVAELTADVQKYRDAKAAWLGEVEANTAKRLEASDKVKTQAGLIIAP